jgi:SAM-dependent methyltransferase
VERVGTVAEQSEELRFPAMHEPAHWGLRRRVLNLLDALHLAGPAVRTYELALAARSRFASRATATEDGLPLPPASLRAQIGPRHADADFFLSSGRQHADLVRDVLREQGTEVDDLAALLDWGCGCGRVLRHWSGLPRTRVVGCDINPKMVEWCEGHLDFAEVSVSELEPPLPSAGSTFDLIYAFSVFTHLSEELQRKWIRECLRVLRPGGYLLISTMGEYYLGLQRLSESERRAFARGELVVLYERSAGTSVCSAYHPPEYVRTKLASDCEHVAFRPAVEGGRHDIHLLRKPARVAVTAEHS